MQNKNRARNFYNSKKLFPQGPMLLTKKQKIVDNYFFFFTVLKINCVAVINATSQNSF